MRLTRDEKRQLARILQCDVRDLSRRLARYREAAEEELVRMILGQRVFTRGQDMREYRLLLLIQHVFEGKLPTEQMISALFQTSTTQSRALLRAVMSKYQYELADGIRGTLKDAIQTAAVHVGGPTGEKIITVDSENVIDALNRELAAADGRLPQIGKLRGTVSTYVVPAESFEKLAHVLR